MSASNFVVFDPALTLTAAMPAPSAVPTRSTISVPLGAPHGLSMRALMLLMTGGVLSSQVVFTCDAPVAAGGSTSSLKAPGTVSAVPGMNTWPAPQSKLGGIVGVSPHGTPTAGANR